MFLFLYMETFLTGIKLITYISFHLHSSNTEKDSKFQSVNQIATIVVLITIFQNQSHDKKQRYTKNKAEHICI